MAVKQKYAKVRMCALCEYIFRKHKMCPMCGFAHYGARWALGAGDKVYRLEKTQELWMSRQVDRLRDELRKKDADAKAGRDFANENFFGEELWIDM